MAASSPSPTPTPIVPGGEIDLQFGPGGESAVGVDEFQWNMKVQALTSRSAYYFWATAVYWQNAPGTGGCPGGGCGAAYFGLQSNSAPANAHRQPIALFSVFGPGTTAVTTGQCTTGADGGPGQSCKIPYPWSVGTPYVFYMQLTSDNGTNETWTGTVENLSTNSAIEIAQWTVPSSWGLLDQTTVSFVEYFGGLSSCAAQPYEQAQLDAPIGYFQGQPYPVQTGYPSSRSACVADTDIGPDSGGFFVQTGLKRTPY